MTTFINDSTDLNIMNLNDDVLYEIIKHLDVFDKISIRQVCQRFQYLIDDYPAKKMKNFIIDHTLDKRFGEIIKNVGKNFEALHLISVNNLNRRDKLKNQLQMINKYCTKLSVLKVETKQYYKTLPLNQAIFAKLNFRNLCYLELNGVKFSGDLDEQCASTFENIEILRLQNVTQFSGRSLINLTKLRSLQLISCPHLLPNHLYDFFKIKPNLIDIDIVRCQHIDEILLNEIIKYLPSIEKLSITFSFTASTNPCCLSALNELRSLNLHNFRSYNLNRFIRSMAAACKKLEQWEIDGEDIKLYRLEEETIEQMEKCTKLIDLSFVKCNFISDDLLLRLAKALDINRFQLRDCWGFSTNGLMHFVQKSDNLIFLAIKNCVIPRTATTEFANIRGNQKKMLMIDHDINCGFRPYEDSDYDVYDDDNAYENDCYYDSNSSDGE